MAMSAEQMAELQEILTRLSQGHLSTILASLEQPNSQIGTSTTSENYAFLRRLTDLGFAEELPLEIDLPSELADTLTSFRIKEEAKADLLTLFAGFPAP